MSTLKNITPNVISIQLFNTINPQVNSSNKNAVIVLQPGEYITESDWIVTDVHQSSYNAEIINTLIENGILTRIK